MGALLLQLAGLRPRRQGRRPLPGWWRSAGRVEARGEVAHDRVTGLPLEVFRARGRGSLLLVPPATLRRGERRIPLAGLYMDRAPVTVAQYTRFVAATGAVEPTMWGQQATYPAHPVVEVAWFQAAAYAAWVGGRLPSEDEWELAARGTDTRRYPWGDEAPAPDRANYAHPGEGEARIQRGPLVFDEYLMDVGSFPAGRSPFGLDDMLGNVAQWCGDPEVPRDPAPGPGGPPREPRRVVRGAAWDVAGGALDLASRSWEAPGLGSSRVGFRTVWAPAAPGAYSMVDDPGPGTG